MIKLDLLDRKFTDELDRLLAGDEALKSRVAQLVLDISWIAARALAEEGSTTSAPVAVPDELLERGRELGADVQSRTKDQALIAAIREVVELSGTLRGVALSDLLTRLEG